MKTILAATDFSKTAGNAINYAAQIAIRSKAKLILLHAYHAPIIATEIPMVFPLPEEIEKNCLKELNKIKVRLLLKYGMKIEVDLVCKCGFAVDEILEYALEKKTDLIVMGTQGAGFVEEKLIGNVTTSLIRKSTVPVLLIGQQVKFRNIKKIAFASDYKKLENPSALSHLKQIAQLFKSHIYILNVESDDQNIPSANEAIEAIKIEHNFEGLKHSFHAITNKDVIKGINGFVEKMNIDLVAMIPRKHNLFQTIANGRNTKKMAFHSNAPLLTLHE